MNRFLATCLLFMTSAIFAQSDTHFSVPSNVYSKSLITVSPEVAGRLVNLLHTGDKFAQGSLLAELDTTHETRLLSLMKANRKVMQEQLALKKSQLDGYENLTHSQSLSKEEKDDKLDELLETQKQLNRLDIDIERVVYLISQKKMIAPYDGIVVSRLTNPSQNVSANTSLLRIFDPNTLYLKAQIPVSQLSKLDLVKGAYLRMENKKIPLSLDYQVEEVDQHSNTIEVSYRLPDATLKLGQDIRLWIKAATNN